jgi:tetratricopeptide (TPR) repeat protein
VKLAQRIGDVTGLAASNNVLGNIAYQESNYIAAQEFYEKGLDYFREAGDLYGIAVVLGSLSTVSYGNADYEREKIYLRERLQIARTIGSRSFVADSLYSLGLVSSLLGQDQNAHIYFDDGLRACAELDETNDIYAAECLAGLAWLLAKERKANQAIRLLGAVERSLNDLDTIFKEIYDQALVVTEEQLDEETFVSNRAAGKAMTVDEAIEYALKVNSKAGQS